MIVIIKLCRTINNQTEFKTNSNLKDALLQSTFKTVYHEKVELFLDVKADKAQRESADVWRHDYISVVNEWGIVLRVIWRLNGA